MKTNINQMAHQFKMALHKHSPEILTGFGIAGMLTSTVLAVQATPKAIRLIEERKDDLQTDKLTVKETVETTWKCYIPAAATAVVSITCLVGASSVNVKRNTALAAAYKLSETTLSEYRNAVVETIGEKKERAVLDKVSEEKIKNNPVDNTEIYFTDRGHTLCFEPISGRYFYTDLDKVKRAALTLTEQILTDPFNSGVSVNDFYDEIGLPRTKGGDDLGWNLDIGTPKVYISPLVIEDNSRLHGEICGVINFTNPPKYDY